MVQKNFHSHEKANWMTSTLKEVLIVDDDPLVAAIFQRVLIDRGHNTLIAANGRAAIKLMALRKFDFVLLDVFMPDKDGIETLREMKQRFPNTTIVVTSGGGLRGRFEFLNIAIKLGADGVVQKPISPEVLIGMVDRREFPNGSTI